jgi:hypothetical protein
MHKAETPRTPQPARKAECCSDSPCESGLRNNYFEGKRLTADGFRAEQSYLVERRRLLNRAIHGWGVVYGYALKADEPDACEGDAASGRLRIGPGLALDVCGHELLHVGWTVLGVDDVILFDRKGSRVPSLPDPDPHEQAAHPKQREAATCWLLSAHYAEQSVGPITINDPCSCERREWDRVCETVRFSLRPVDCEDCCRGFPCELKCDCGTGPCCDEERPKDVREAKYQGEKPHHGHGNPVRRGGCQCLCEHLTVLQPGDECCGRLCEIEEKCARVSVDLHHGVPLACVRLRRDECDSWVFEDWIEACGPRRLVKRNDLLFDLIRGCDLTRISAIGWAEWHRAKAPIAWDAFRKSFGDEDPPDSGRNVTSRYWVEFSRPVRADTVRIDCFSMTVIVAEDEAGWGEPRRVPILDVELSGASGMPAGFATRATLVVDAGWVDDALESRKTIFNQDEALVEIEIRGDYIVDCNGQTVDANAVGLSAAPSGNGSPGGTFLSNFYVRARDSQARAAPYEDSQRAQGAQS